MTVQPFDPAFITQYQNSFTEVVRLASLASQRSILGKQPRDEDQRVDQFLKVLKALSIPGLSADNIESLEYDLISQNESLVIPTVQSLYPGRNYFRSLKINTPGVYQRTTNDITFVTSARLVLDPAQRSISEPSIDLQATVSGIENNTLSLDTAVRTITRQDITLTTYEATLDIEATLSSAFGGSTFRVNFSGAVRSFTLVQGFDLVPVTSSGVIDFPSGSTTTATVRKISNGGIAQDAGTIVWRKNGVDVNTYSFVLGENLGGAGKAYTYTGLVDSDEISVYIAEG